MREGQRNGEKRKAATRQEEKIIIEKGLESRRDDTRRQYDIRNEKGREEKRRGCKINSYNPSKRKDDNARDRVI